MNFNYRRTFFSLLTDPKWIASDFSAQDCAFTSTPKLDILFNFVLVSKGIRPSALFTYQHNIDTLSGEDFVKWLQCWGLPNVKIWTKFDNPSRSYLLAYNSQLLTSLQIAASFESTEELGALLGYFCPRDISKEVGHKLVQLPQGNEIRHYQRKFLMYLLHNSDQPPTAFYYEKVDDRFSVEEAMKRKELFASEANEFDYRVTMMIDTLKNEAEIYP